MAFRNYVSPTFKSSIFNSNIEIDKFQSPPRVPQVNSCKNSNELFWRPKKYEMASSQKTFDFNKSNTKEISLNNSKSFSMNEQSMLRASKDVMGSSFNENVTKHQRQANRGLSREDPKEQSQSSFYQEMLEDAINEKKRFLKGQNDYRHELEIQIKEKQRRHQTEKIIDLSFTHSGFPIGEVHGGFDVEQCAKDIRIRENKKAREESQKKGSNTTKREVSLDTSITNHLSGSFSGSPTFRPNSMSIVPKKHTFNTSDHGKGEEEIGTQIKANSMFIHEEVNKSVKINSKHKKANNYSEYLRNPSESKYHIKRIHHEKLRETIRAQVKKCEEYTLQLLEDNKKRKDSLRHDLQNQIVSKEQSRNNSTINEKKRERSSTEVALEAKRRKGSSQSTQLLLAQPIQISQDKENTPTKPKVVKKEREGFYQKLVNNTLQQLIERKTKALTTQTQKKIDMSAQKSFNK